METDFGDRLIELAARMPVWIVDTLANRQVAERLCAKRSEATQSGGVTTFRVSPTRSAEGWLADVLPEIDLHHGPYSLEPPYSVIEVFGASLTPKLQETFSKYGLVEFVVRPGGFVATRRHAPA